MVDLFRYVEHDFPVPTAVDAIDVANDSAFQADLDVAARSEGEEGAQASHEQVRALARDFLDATFESPTADPTTLGPVLATFHHELSALSPATSPTVRKLVRDTFGATPHEVVTGADFAADLALIQNAVLAVKLVTGFDQVDSGRVVRQLRAAMYLRDLDDAPADTVPTPAALLARPIRIPPLLLDAVASPPPAPLEPSRADQDVAARFSSLRDERDLLQASHDVMLAVPPDRLTISGGVDELRPIEGEGQVLRRSLDAQPELGEATELPRPAADLVLGESAREALDPGVLRALRDLAIEPGETALATSVEVVSRRLRELNDELLPLEVVANAVVFQVGAHLFAEAPVAPMTMLAGAGPAPAGASASKAVTRPVGIGRLQVVRQELVGYEAGDISHIENVLEGELLRRRTIRVEESETTAFEEMVSAQSQERDQQSTERNELASETQKEAGHQTTATGQGMSSNEYGKLVENSRTGFARSVSARAVDSVTSSVRTQRSQRESRRYAERARHELDNSAGDKKIRGIYQWVNKRYSLRVLNYGKRLMYDVVVPEPAAFLVEALKRQAQPEGTQLSKPLPPNLTPAQVNGSNYAYYAAAYGVTGSVAPPPDAFTQTVAKAEALNGSKQLKAYGAETDVAYSGAFTLRVPEGYRAVGGYVQRVSFTHFGSRPERRFEFFIGESTFLSFSSGAIDSLNSSFVMNGETGEIPVTFRTFAEVISFTYAVALTCQRTDKAYEQWQLKTHAAIVSGYQRMKAEYDDKLARYVTAARTRLAAASGYGHDPTVEREELKKAFTTLLLGEHPGSWLPTPTPAPMPPYAALPDPVAVREWGAMVAFFERAFEWENLMTVYYPYYWGRPSRWEEMLLTQDVDPTFEAFLKAGAARVVVPVRPGFEAALAHYQETGDVWMGEEIPDMFGDHYLSIIEEIKAANFAPGDEVCVEQWEVTLPTTLVLLRDDATLPSWTPTPCNPPPP